MVIWSDPAIEDLNSVFKYICADSRHYAEKMIGIALEKSEMLNEFPGMGRIVPEQNNDKIREVFVYSYRMIYQISNSNVEILAFIHEARDLTSEEFSNLF